MLYKYVASSNTATNGSAIAAAGQDIRVFKLIIGAPVSGGNILLYNKSVAYNGDTDNIAFKLTLPTFSTTNLNIAMGNQVIDFGSEGLQIDGGNLMIDQTMQVTLVYEVADRV